MNHYAQLARERHRLARPIQHELIEDPESFFTTIGRELEAEVTTVRDELAGPRGPGESVEDYRTRQAQCLTMAEELTLAEHFLFQPESPLAEGDLFSDEELAQDPALAQHYAELALIDQAIADFYRPDDT
jgi:hypothetical protein